jgi:uncharacterized protein (TIRG00374 family)
VAATALVYLAAAAAIYVFIDRAVLEAALSLPLGLVGALLGLSLANYLARAWRWVVLGEQLRLAVPVLHQVLYYLAGYCFTSTPAKAGEAVRLWFLRAGHGVPYARSLPMMLADRAIDLWAVLILSLVSVAGFAAYAWQGALLAGVLALVSLPLLFPRRLRPLVNRLYGWWPSRGRALVRLRRAIAALDELASWRSYGLTLVPSIGGWFAECAALYLLLQQFGAHVSMLDAVFVFSFGMIVGALSMLPGGLGSTEATMVLLLGAIGVDVDVALAATAIIRLTTFWFAIALGSALLPLALRASAHASRGAAQRPEAA